MASNSGPKSGSSGRSSSRKRVVIGADETTRVRYSRDKPQVESERRKTPRQTQRASAGVKSAAPKPSGAGRRIANEKRDERDRRRRSIGRRRFAIVVLLALLAAGVLWGLVKLWNAPLFPVKQIEVTGNSRLTREAILASASVSPDATLPRLPKAAILERLNANPWIAQAGLTRSYPSTVRIAVTERVPAALVDAGGGDLWMVAADGHWLGRRSAEDTVALTTIKDMESVAPTSGTSSDSAELANALAVLAGLSPELKARVRAVSASSIDKTMLVLDDDVQVFVGSSEDIAKKDQLTREILSREKRLVYINVRVVERPTWRGLDQGN